MKPLPAPDSPAFTAGGFAPGMLFAGYRIERVIARRVAGGLYGAIDTRNGLAVALKTMSLSGEYEGSDLDEARARFIREARTAIGLHHPDIVVVHGGGESMGQAFIVMELLGGCDLTRYTRPSRLLPEPVAVRIMARVADALAYAHTAGVVHRDIKPSNVMVDLARHQVKVTDFGIARVADSARSRSGVMVGTPSFMSPEQLAGAAVDGRTDLYALGVTLFQLLTGKLPYEASSMGLLLMQIARGAPRELRSLRPDLPAELSHLVAALLCKQPAERPAGARMVAEHLRRIEATWGHAPGQAPARALLPISSDRTLAISASGSGDPGHNPSRS